MVVVTVSITLLFTGASVRALEASGFTFVVSSGSATVTGCVGTCSASLVIPAALGDYAVNNIGEQAFYNNSLTAVVIPNSVTNIGRSAFSSNSLTTVVIPNSVTNIGDFAFHNNSLTIATIGSSVTNIGDQAFNGNSLTTLVIPNSVTNIGDYAFSYNSLTTVTIGRSVTTIGNSAFYDNRLTTVIIPNSVRSISNWAFTVNQLSAVTIGNSVTSIGDWAFAANSLTSVTFLGNAPTHGISVLESNFGLTSVTRSSTATGWSSTWGGKPVVVAAEPVDPAEPEEPVAQAVATLKPTISGTASFSKELKAAKGTWTGYPTPTFTYQWYACTKAVKAPRMTVPSTCKKIAGATRSIFRLKLAQRNKYVAVLVTGKSNGTPATTWLSKTTIKVK